MFVKGINKLNIKFRSKDSKQYTCIHVSKVAVKYPNSLNDSDHMHNYIYTYMNSVYSCQLDRI